MSKRRIKKRVKVEDRNLKKEKVSSSKFQPSIFVICLFLIAVTLAIFGQTFNHDFVDFDDFEYVVDNPHVFGGITKESVIWAFTSFHAANWHPVTWLSHMLDCQIYGLNPGMHHLTNVFIHILNSLILLMVLCKMTGALWRSAIVAALFALHPLHVESVAWIAERKDLLSAFFGFISMGCYIRYVRKPKILWYILVIVFFALGLMAKPMLVTLPFVLILLDFFPLNRLKWNKKSVFQVVIEKIPLLALSTASSIITFIAQQKSGAVQMMESLPLEMRVSNAFISYISYLRKIVFPYDLAAYYPYPNTIPAWQIFGAGILLALLTLVLILASRKFPYLAVGWLWYIGMLVPVIGIVQVGSQAMADRYTYIPLVGIFILISWGIFDMYSNPSLSKIQRQVGLFALSLTCVLLVVLTWFQVRYWKDTLTLFQHAVQVTENNYIAHNNLGAVFAGQKKYEQAIIHYTEALNIKPDYAEAHNNIGGAYQAHGNNEKAKYHYKQALGIVSNFAKAHNNYGSVLEQEGKHTEAFKHYSEALRINPNYAEAHNNLGVYYERIGKPEKAEKHFSQAVKIKPRYAKANHNLGRILEMQGRYESADFYYAEAVRLNPENADYHYSLGTAFGRKGNLANSIFHFNEAIRLKPDYAEAHYNLGVALMRLNRVEQAIFHFETALKIKPDYEKALQGLEQLNLKQ